MISITIPGTPVGKGRGRIVRRGSHLGIATPDKTVRYEATVSLAASQAMDGNAPMDGPLSVAMRVFVPIPASWSQRKQQQAQRGELWPAKKPDIDNVVKAVADGMNGITWADDAQIVSLNVVKRYGVRPCVEVDVVEMEGEA